MDDENSNESNKGQE